MTAEVRPAGQSPSGAPKMSAPLLLQPLRIRELALRNRIVISAMCQYAAADGMPGDWQLVHLGRFAIGGVGLMFTEATAIEPRGRISHGCTGIWNDGQALAWARVLQVWLEDEDPALSKTMAELDRVLTRGERAVAGLDRVSAITSPVTAFVQAAFDAGRRARRGGNRSARKDDPGDEDVTAL